MQAMQPTRGTGSITLLLRLHTLTKSCTKTSILGRNTNPGPNQALRVATGLIKLNNQENSELIRNLCLPKLRVVNCLLRQAPGTLEHKP